MKEMYGILEGRILTVVLGHLPALKQDVLAVHSKGVSMNSGGSRS